MSRRTAKEVGKTVESIESKKKTQLNSTVWPKPTRMRTTSFTRVTTMQVTGATVYSCFVLVWTHRVIERQGLLLSGLATFARSYYQLF